MTISDNIKERLRKIYALAIQGVDGEREVATAQLKSLMKKYGLSVGDITGQERKNYRFKIPKAHDEQEIFWQVVLHYLNKDRISYTRSRYDVNLELTKEEYIDISGMLDFYLREYRKDKEEQLKVFSLAFIQKNNLFPDSTDSADKDASVSVEQIRRYLAAMAMAENMERKQYCRQLEE